MAWGNSHATYLIMSEPRIYFNKDGEQVITYSKNVTEALLAEGELFTSPPEPEKPAVEEKKSTTRKS